MAEQTDLSVAPYFNRFNEQNGYYKVAFRPGVSVQVGELQEIQSIFQNQIERFADNIIKSGSIISGCNFIYNSSVAYIKILDLEPSGITVIPALLNYGYIQSNTSGLKAQIINFVDGFESQSPDLKTLYLHYINSGINGQTKTFSAGEVLTVYNTRYSLFKVNIINGGSGISNTDSIVVTPALAVKLTSGSFNAGDYICDATPGAVANLQIIQVNYATLASTGEVILYVRPRQADLYSPNSTYKSWTININASIKNPANSVVGSVTKVFGSGAQGKIQTDTAGVVKNISITDIGANYTVVPDVHIFSKNNSSGIAGINLIAQNYISKVKISTAFGSIGVGYTFGVTKGVIYQKGYFERVDEQSVIVQKYSNTPDGIVAGFSTREEIITPEHDTSLYDNALGTPNYTAPGAHRLKLTPQLVVMDKTVAEGNDQFFSLVEWNNGNPFKENRSTVYNIIGDTIAQQTYDATGNYVTDPFSITTASSANAANEGKFYQLIADRGRAYINGRKVETQNVSSIEIPKGPGIVTTYTDSTTVQYGNYIRVNEFSGTWLFNWNRICSLSATPLHSVSNSSVYNSGGAIPNFTIGTAFCRQVVLENGTPGTPEAVYRIYLYHIIMNPGYNFSDVKSIYATGVIDSPPYYAAGFADIILNASNKAQLVNPGWESILFNAYGTDITGVGVSNAAYTYKSVDHLLPISNTGIVVKSIPAGINEFLLNAGVSLTPLQLYDYYMVPTTNNLIVTPNMGNCAVNTSAATVVGGAGTNFFSDFATGDFISVETTLGNREFRRVLKINNSNTITTDNTFSAANTTANYTRVFPRNIPIPFGYRTGLIGNVDTETRRTTTLVFNHANSANIAFIGNSVQVGNVSLTFPVRREGISPGILGGSRNRWVKIHLGTHPAGTKGPWCLGTPGVIRLRNVYYSLSNNFPADPSAFPDIVDKFYVDHNENASFNDLSFLYMQPNARYSLDQDAWLLVKIDCIWVGTPGFYDVSSYRRTTDYNGITSLDSRALEALDQWSICTHEIPQVWDKSGAYYDLLNCIDFRPSIANTANVIATVAVATVNPPAASFTFLGDLKLPPPGTLITYVRNTFLPRVDNIFVGINADIIVRYGKHSYRALNNIVPESPPKNSMQLQRLFIAAYPTYPQVLSDNLKKLVNTRVYNIKILNQRLNQYSIRSVFSSSDLNISQPKAYTMKDIGDIDRRLTDVEQYVSLSILESNLSNQKIPSSIDPSLDRYKFGFFADDFSSNSYSDLANPQYAAGLESVGDVTSGSFGDPLTGQIKDSFTTNLVNTSQPISKKTNHITPPVYSWEMFHIIENVGYSHTTVVNQSVSTKNTACSIISNTLPLTSNAYFTSQQKSVYGSEKSVDTIIMGANSGNVTIYFFNYFNPVKISVYAGANLVAGTMNTLPVGSSLTSYTQADNTFLSTNPNTQEWYNLNTILNWDLLSKSPLRSSQAGFTDYISYGGKISFQHLPSVNGRWYNIIVEKAPGSTLWKYVAEFPTTSQYVDQTTVNIGACAPPAIKRFIGTVDLSSIYLNVGIVKCTGLKPVTLHYIYLNNQSFTNITPVPFNIDNFESFYYYAHNSIDTTQPLITDEYGTLNLIINFPVQLYTFGDVVQRGSWWDPFVGNTQFSQLQLEISDNNSWDSNISLSSRSYGRFIVRS